MKDNSARIVVGFWMRLVSDFADVILLGAFGYLIAIPLKNVLYEVGEKGVWIGLIITLLYVGILQSYLGKGQTIAKRIFRIQVVRVDGSYMGLPRSFLRCLVIALIVYNGWILSSILALAPPLNNPIFVNAFVSLVIACLLGLLILVPFHPLKRGLQDLIAGSIVIRKGRYDGEKLSRRRNVRRTRILYGAYLLICAVVIVGLNIYWARLNIEFAPYLNDISAEVKKVEGVENIGVSLTDVFMGKSTTRRLNVTASINHEALIDKEARDAIIEHLLDATLSVSRGHPDIDYVDINVYSGFNIGIAALKDFARRTFTPDGKPLN